MGAALAACAAEQAPDRPELGRLAPPYAAATLEGDTVSLASLRGEVVLLNMWATWCIPCRTETPFLQSLHDAHTGEGLRVVGVSMDSRVGEDQIREFVEQYGVEYTILHDAAMRGMDLYRVIGLPANFLIDREGRIQWMSTGPVGEEDQQFIAALGSALGAR